MGLIAGCQLFESGGKAVKFTAAAKNDLGTKTVYAPYTSGTKQDIYWSDNDQIAIYSSDTGIAASPSGDNAAYKLNVQSDKTQAKLSNTSADSHGLTWQDGATGSVYFDAVYPAGTSVVTETSPTLHKFVMNILKDQTYGAITSEADGTVMTNAYMVAMKEVQAGNDVALEFYPAFTAFEIELKNSETTELTLTKVAIKSDTQNLSGDYFTRWTRVTAPGTGMFFGTVDGGTLNKEVSVTLPANTTITDTKSVHFTLLALPFNTSVSSPMYESTNLSSLYLEVTYVVPGSSPAVYKTRKLDLKQNGSFINFAGCKKHRITGLAFDGGSNWRLTINDQVLPWDREDGETTFSKNIESGPFVISNAVETGNHYYPAGTKDYQVRTLDLENGKTFFEVTFLPMAPLGGYWMLVPESNAGMGTSAFRVVIWDEESDPTDTPDLKGQIMNQTVTLHIISMVTDEQRTEDHAIIIKSYFSSSVSFDENSTFSADSEIQDAHKDGSFSYWRFVIPAKNN